MNHPLRKLSLKAETRNYIKNSQAPVNLNDERADRETDTEAGVHLLRNTKTPLRPDACALSAEEKIKIISGHVKEILHTLGLDLLDESIRDTPLRVAKMYVNETFKGLDPAHQPDMTLFDNAYQYQEMLVEKNITFYSTCEHHLVPIFGKVHLAYYSSGKVIGLSKLNRLVDYYARRPQVQERLSIQIAEALKNTLQTEDVAVLIDSTHLCVASRGIRDVNSTTITAEYSGKFKNREVRNEFLAYIGK
ncbi:MAG: GTP cyclohydrolase I FolE [Bacteroidia bacterium]|nr:GTP cyclohydrolase I FolE [Bacteroidia bacterium]